MFRPEALSAAPSAVDSPPMPPAPAKPTTAAPERSLVQRMEALQRANEIRTKRRGIVLFHDVHDKTVDMIKEILPTLIEEGYKFAPLQEVPSVKRAIAPV